MELHAISQKIREGGGRFEITMPSHSRKSFLQATSSCYDNYFILLRNIDAEYSFCSRPDDMKSIHKAIIDSIGFDGLNRSIYSVISQWIIDQIKAYINSIKGQDPLELIPRMQDLGKILKEMGRYEEALHVLQEASQMFAKIGSVAPKLFGTNYRSLDAQIDRQIVRIYVHLGQYDLAQECHDALFAKWMSTKEQLHSKEHPGSNLQDFFAGQDRDLNSSLEEGFSNILQEAVRQHPEMEIFQTISKAERSSVSTEWNTLEFASTFAHMSFYTLLIMEDAESSDYLKACGSVNDTDFLLLENAISDPLSNIKLKKMAFDLKSDRLPIAHPTVSLAMLRLAHAYIDGDQSELALPLLQFCLPLLRRLPPLHSNIALALLLRSTCLLKNGELAAASSEVLEALSICENVSDGIMNIPADWKWRVEKIARYLQENEVIVTELLPEGGDVLVSKFARAIKKIIKKIGFEEARIKKVIINHGSEEPQAYASAHMILLSQRTTRDIWRKWNADHADSDGQTTSLDE